MITENISMLLLEQIVKLRHRYHIPKFDDPRLESGGISDPLSCDQILAAHRRDNHSRFILALDNLSGSLIGYARVSVSRNSLSPAIDDNELKFHVIIVDKAHRKEMVLLDGTKTKMLLPEAILEMGLTFGRSKNCKKASCLIQSSPVKNRAAAKFFQKHGFNPMEKGFASIQNKIRVVSIKYELLLHPGAQRDKTKEFFANTQGVSVDTCSPGL